LKEYSDAPGGLGGKKICFSLPPPFKLIWSSQWRAYGDIEKTEEYRDTRIWRMTDILEHS